MTYNVHGCVGVDHRLDAARIALVIAESEADVVALQELDVGRPRSHGADQPRVLAELLGMDLDFCSARECEGGRYGNAVLSRHPLACVRAAPLPHHLGCERRALQWVQIDADGCTLHVLNTHLGLNGSEREHQARAITSPEWLPSARADGATVLCGDLNATPGSDVYRMLTDPLRDAQLAGVHDGPHGTFPSLMPWLRLDYVLVSPEVCVRRSRVLTTWTARVASDHLPVVVDLEVTS